MKKNTYIKDVDMPLMHPDHKRPVTRREFVSQGFSFGTGLAMGGSLAGLMAGNKAHALSDELDGILRNQCGAFSSEDAKIPFICFDLAGGANFAGSSVLVGGPNGQLDTLDTSGYQRLGLPANMTPDSSTGDFIDESFGLKFHSDSPYLRGMLEKVEADARGLINGAVIPARSENDTGNNPHNPMYSINKIGANGELLALIGSRSSDSGGNSMAPMANINLGVRPTKIDRASDATSLVDTGELINLLGRVDTEAVMESVYHLSKVKMDRVSGAGLTTNDLVGQLVECGYLKAASNAERDKDSVNPDTDDIIVGEADSIFSAEDYEDREFRKTAAIMKLVIDGWAGAGTITMGGYDYHGGRRARGETRDFRAGRAIGAVLQYAHRQQKPVMVYVFSDGSLSSNGMIDDTVEGRDKGEWTSDNQQTACSWFMVYNPGGKPQLLGGTEDEQFRHQQIGHFRPSGNVETSSSPMANNVNLLVDAVALNYMALHGEVGGFVDMFGNQLGATGELDRYVAFNPIVNGNIGNPVT
ncbi:MAG: hypothetical protein ACRBCI_11425 [Cellvibrionaceae bacterium]